MESMKNNKKDIESVQLSTVNERISMGNKLYIAAWTFEIVVAIIALLVAFYQGFDAWKSFKDIEGGVLDEHFADVALVVSPFIVVALAEILKIPIIQLVYINRNILTKVFFSLILFGLTFITFETVSSGFERQFSNITSKVQRPVEELRLTQEKIISLRVRADTDKDKTQIINWKKKIKELEGDRERLIKEANELANLAQMYRFTKYWMNFSAPEVCEEYYENEKVCKKYVIKEVTMTDVTLDSVTKVAFWWYGSLAALVSIMGVVLAFGALILRHPKEKYKDLNLKKTKR